MHIVVVFNLKGRSHGKLSPEKGLHKKVWKRNRLAVTELDRLTVRAKDTAFKQLQ